MYIYTYIYVYTYYDLSRLIINTEDEVKTQIKLKKSTIHHLFFHVRL